MSAVQAVAVDGVFVDYICDLTQHDYITFFGTPNEGTTLTTISVKVGGTAVEFAVAAKQAGFDSSILIGKIGGYQTEEGIIPDASGQQAIDYLKQYGISSLLALDEKHETGKSIIAYLASNKRLMLSDPSANRFFTAEDITSEMEEAVKHADLVHFTGYSLLHNESLQAVLALMKQAKKTGKAIVALDIVPHKFYQRMSLVELISHVGQLVDLVFIELATAHQLVGEGFWDQQQITDDKILHISQKLSLCFPTVVVSPSPDTFKIISKDKYFEYRAKDSLPTGTNQRGYTSRVQAQFLHWYLSQQPS